MEKRRIWLNAKKVFLILILVACGVFPSMGSPFQLNGSEIVFLLDTSGSMNTQDKNRLAIDAIRQAAYSLPSSYKVGVVAYHTGIQTIIPFDVEQGQMEAQLGTISYSGYTNAGEGMNQAVALFSDRENVDRYIIMLSDGEIDMPDRRQREASRTLYTQAANLAKEKGVKICIIAVGSELNDPQMHIFDGAELTDGTIYWEGQSGSLTQIMEKIIADRLGFSRQLLGITDSNGGTIHADLPEGVSRAKVVITSNGPISQVAADYTAESGHTVTGQHFAVVDMERPSSGVVEARFSAADISGIKAYLLTEFIVKPKVNVNYRVEQILQTEEELKKRIPPKYEHFADVAIEVADRDGKQENLLAGSTFDGREIPYMLNGVFYTGRLEQGKINQSISADRIDRIEVSVDISGLEGIYYTEQPVTVEISKTPDPVYEPEPDYQPLWITLGTLASVIVCLGIWWIKKSSTTVIYVAQPPASREPAKKVETKTCTYSGKFNMYIVRTADGRDMPPQTYQLFGRNSGRMTLGQIFTSCKLKLGKNGEDDIIIYPGPDHSVIIMDQSERCTVLRGMEILKKGMGYPVFYNEKITITFEDESTEMEIHYKSLKPGERNT